MKLHDVAFSSNCKKVRVCAHELELPVEIVPIHVERGENRTPDYLALNPMGKFPVLEDGDFVLWESAAILVYLCGKRPERELWPTDARGQADGMRWLLWYSAHVQPNMTALAVERFIKPKLLNQPGNDPHIIGYAEKELERFIPVLEHQLEGRDYVQGRYSIVDIALGCGLESSARVGVELARYPNTAKWVERLQAREAWRKAGG